MAHPTRIVPITCDLQAPQPLDIASAAICLTLLDFETTLWTDLDIDSAALNWLRFHCACPIVSQTRLAQFALVIDHWEMLHLDHFPQGEEEYPERSTSLIIQVDGLIPGKGRKFSGPGIKNYSYLDVAGIPEHFWAVWQGQIAQYPLGVDVFISCGSVLAALPRTIRIES